MEPLEAVTGMDAMCRAYMDVFTACRKEASSAPNFETGTVAKTGTEETDYD